MKQKKCGIILIDENSLEKKYLVVYSKKSKKFGFPKGTQEQGESYTRTALREFREETGYTFQNPNLKLHEKEKLHVLNNIYYIVRFQNNRNEFLQDQGIQDTKEIAYKLWMTKDEISQIPKEKVNLGLNFYKKILCN